MKELGGPDLPGVGFSFGIERVVSVLSDNELLNDVAYELDAYIMPLDKSLDLYAQEVAVILRNSGGYKVDVCFDNVKLGNMFKRATNKNAKYAIIIGEDEAKAESVVLKDLASQEQITVKIEDLVDKLDELYETSYPEEEEE